MQFESFSDFFAMGGYGFFVWLSFGVTLVVMVGLFLVTRFDKRHLFAEVQREEARKIRIRDAQSHKNTQVKHNHEC